MSAQHTPGPVVRGYITKSRSGHYTATVKVDGRQVAKQTKCELVAAREFNRATVALIVARWMDAAGNSAIEAEADVSAAAQGRGF